MVARAAAKEKGDHILSNSLSEKHAGCQDKDQIDNDDGDVDTMDLHEIIHLILTIPRASQQICWLAI